MAKQLNVNLAFTADTSKAKTQLQDLQKSLDSLLKGSAQSADLPITKELMEAQNLYSKNTQNQFQDILQIFYLQ